MKGRSFTNMRIAVLLLGVRAWATYYAPYAVIDNETVSVTLGETVYLADGGSYDPDGGSIAAWQWTCPSDAFYVFGRDTASFKCKFGTAGNYTVYLKVQDDEGVWSGLDSCTVTVTGSSNAWYVDDGGSDENNNGQSPASPLGRIQTAIHGATSGDVVWVAEGTYFENIDFLDKNIIVRSNDPDDSEVVASTIIDAGGVGTAVVFGGGEDTTCQLKGFTIRGGGPVEGLLAHWEFENDFTDSAGGHTGTALGNAACTGVKPAVGSYALALDGDGDRVQINGYKGVRGRQARTCMAWVRPSEAAEMDVLYWGENAAGKRWRVSLYPVNGEAYLKVDVLYGRSFGTTNVADGQWHHVAVTWENDGTPDIADARLYVDGVLEAATYDASGDVNTSMSDDADDLCIGKSPANRCFEGLIDDVRIYGRALAGWEVAELASTPMPGSRWQFEQDPNDSTGDNAWTGQNNPTYSGDEKAEGSHSLHLNGSSQYATVPGYKGVTGSRSRSVATWIKTGTQGGGIIGWGSPTGPDGSAWGLYVDDGTLGNGGEICLTVGGDYIIGNDVVDANDWHHVAVVLEDDGSPVVSEIKLYVDGRLQNATCEDGTTPINTYSSNDVVIGCTSVSAGDYFNGYIDDVRIYNRALSPLEVLELGDDNLEVHLMLDEITGTTAEDSTSNNYDGTLTNMPASPWGAGLFDGALGFGGTDDYVVLDGTSGTEYKGISNSDPRTVSAWIKTSYDGTSGQGIIAWGNDNAAGNRWLFWVNGSNNGNLGAIRAAVNGGTIIGTADVRDGRWHHVAAVLEAGDSDVADVKLYVDGVLEPTSYVATQTINTPSDKCVHIGAHYTPNSYFEGVIDDVRIYSRGLSADQIKCLANKRPNLEARWSFDDGSGDTATNVDLDNAAAGYYDGALTNMDTNNDWVDGLFGSALHFDGTNDYVGITDFHGITGGTARTCMAWIKTTTTGDIISWGNNNIAGAKWRFSVGWSSNLGKIGLMTTSGYIFGSTQVDDNTWHHVAAVLEDDGSPDVSEVKLYVDGVPEVVGSVTPQPINTSGDMVVQIGVYRTEGILDPPYSGCAWFSGLIDDVRIYNVALSETEIRQVYLAHGGGINGSGSQAQIRNCVIKDNYSEYDGAGIFNADGTISKCRILDNEAEGNGGGLADCDGTVINTIIAGNQADKGGGVDNCTADILSCTVVSNTATTAGGGIRNCSGTIKNCIIWGNGDDLDNASATYSCIEDGDTGTGNISCSPSFVNASGGDYHLLTSSLCIDAGDRASDYTYEPAPNGSRINLGAYGNTPEAAKTIDTDGDGMPDIWEIANNLNPNSSADATLDNDAGGGDGLTNYWEYLCGTDPFDADSDNDQINDGDEDFDGDGMSNLLECQNGLDPLQSNEGEGIALYEYDDAGQVTRTRNLEVVDGVLHMTESRTEYDILGRQKLARRVANPVITSGGGGISNANDMITLYGYDAQGHLTLTVQKGYNQGTPNTNTAAQETGDLVTENTYDSFGHVLTTENGAGEATTYAYSNGQLQTVTNDDSKVVTTNYYDDAGRLEKVVDAEGHYRTMEYDSLGHVIREIAWEEQGANDEALMQKRFAYDGVGHLVIQAVMASADSTAAIDPNTDMVTTWAYDDGEDTYPGLLAGQTIYYAYDSTSQTSSTATTTFDYDYLGRRVKTTDPDGNETIVQYDEMGRTIRRQQKDYHPLVGGTDLVMTTDYTYDDDGRLIAVTEKPQNPDAGSDPSWRTTEYAYALNMRLKETKPNDVVTTYDYDAFGHKTTMVADADYTGHTGLKQTTEWGFDRLGRQVSIAGYTGVGTGGTKQTTTYDYDGAGRVTKITYPDTKTIEYAYNAGNRVGTRTDQRNVLTDYGYDNNYNLITKTVTMTIDSVQDTWVETFTYDGLNRMLTAQKVIDETPDPDTPISLIEYAYNDLGRITDFDQTLFGGTERQIDYSYDQYGFLKSTTYPDGSTVIGRTNDWRGRIATLSRGQDELVAYDYIGSRVAKRSYGVPGVAAEFGYDNLGRVTDIDYGESVVGFGYSYVADENNIYRKTFDHRAGDPYNEYTYDDLDRLTDAEYHDSDTEAFVMDALGNRTGEQTLRDDGAVNFTVDSAANRYTAIGGSSITHDDAGNLTVDKDGYKYWYDYENRVVKIQKPDGLGGWDDVAEMAYDALGRRIRVIDSVASATTLYYYNPEWQCLAEYRGAGALQRYFVYGNYIDEPLIMHRQSDGEDYYYGQDHLYSTVILLDDGGNVVERYEYDAYGTTHIMDALYNSRSVSSCGNPYTFTGRRLDVLDGGGLLRMHYRHRDYDVYTGRFCQNDPLTYVDGMNLYQYVRSSPVSAWDPYGLIWPGGFPITTLGAEPPGFVPPPSPSPADEYQKCTEAEPTSDIEVCKIHGKDRIQKVGLSWGARCVCECAGDSPWDNQVRGCLACAKAKNLDMIKAHKLCYAAADREHGVRAGIRARLDIPINCKHCACRKWDQIQEISDDWGL